VFCHIQYGTKTGEEPVNKAISVCIYNLEAIESRYSSSIRVNPEAYRIGSYVIDILKLSISLQDR